MVTFKDRIIDLRRIPAQELQANPKNWRRHPASQRAALQGILEDVGFADAVIARETPDGLELIDGHLRQEVMGDQLIPVLVLDVTKDEADKMLATLDPLAAMAQSDKQALSSLLTNIQTDNEKLSAMLSTLGIFDTEHVAIDELHPHPRNYVKHPEAQLEHLAQSIKDYGLYRNVVIAQDGTILAGHGVVEAARRTGLVTIPVVRLGIGADDPKALKLLAGDNETSNLAEVDDRALTDMLKEIYSTGPGALVGTGYDEQMLASLAMVTRPQEEIEDFDEAAEWLGMPDFESSDEFEGQRLLVRFDCEADRDAFMVTLRTLDPNFKPVIRSKKVWSTWWPWHDKDDVMSVRLES